VSKQELADIARAYPPAEATQQLVALSNERGGHDNITVSITHITDSQVQGEAASAGQLPEVPPFFKVEF
jgi:serine/threonine protein phosphatase PrpC